MNIPALTGTLAIASLSLVLCACATTRTETAHVQQRAAEEIVADVDAAAYPPFDSERREDEEYVAQYLAQRDAVAQQRAALAKELYRVAPDHDRLVGLISERWNILAQAESEKAQQEVDEVAAKYAADTPLGREARYVRASSLLGAALWEEGDLDHAMAAVEQFIEATDDTRAAFMLFRAAVYGYEGGSAEQIRLLERVRVDYGDSEDDVARRAVRNAEGQLRQLAAIGHRFDFEFVCAVTGSEVSTDTLAGKVIVIDFWATWCGPCIAKMPEMKRLYDRFRDSGVEFVGISLDMPEEQGGLESLLAFVEDNDLPWPQWYQGGGWQSEFSSEWGISGIPTLFIVDAEGRLRSTTARGKLEELIEQLIEEREERGHQAAASS